MLAIGNVLLPGGSRLVLGVAKLCDVGDVTYFIFIRGCRSERKKERAKAEREPGEDLKRCAIVVQTLIFVRLLDRTDTTST